MTDATTRIKNLSIALEAVSRTPASERLAAEIWILLTTEVQKYAEKKGLKEAARPAKTSSDNPLFNK